MDNLKDAALQLGTALAELGAVKEDLLSQGFNPGERRKLQERMDGAMVQVEQVRIALRTTLA